MGDLEKAQAQLNEKEAELQEVQSMYERAVKEKQVIAELVFMSCTATLIILPKSCEFCKNIWTSLTFNISIITIADIVLGKTSKTIILFIE